MLVAASVLEEIPLSAFLVWIATESFCYSHAS